jgi:hypothetical protein
MDLTDKLLTFIDKKSSCYHDRPKNDERLSIVRERYDWKRVSGELENFIWGIVQHVNHPSHPFAEAIRKPLGPGFL